jgi:hypothetical protein
MSKSFKFDPDSPSYSYGRKVKYNNQRRTKQEHNRSKIFMESVLRSQDSNDIDNNMSQSKFTLAS